MFDRILVPLDGSEQSESICDYVLDLARSIGSEVGLLRVLRHGGSMSPPDNPTIETAREYLYARARVFEESGVRALSEVSVGNPAREIQAWSRSIGADLIAMATRRESALSRTALGSVTDAVLRATGVPLLTMCPPRLGDSRATSSFPVVIVVPLDGSDLSETSVPVALSLAKATKAAVVFVRVLPSPYPAGGGPGARFFPPYGVLEAERREVDDYLSGFVERARLDGIEAASHALVGHTAPHIVGMAAKRHGALVVMSTHGASGFRRWTVGSFTERVIRSSGQPVLALTPNTRTGEPEHGSEREASLVGSH